jgi:hypothetical protein
MKVHTRFWTLQIQTVVFCVAGESNLEEEGNLIPVGYLYHVATRHHDTDLTLQ